VKIIAVLLSIGLTFSPTLFGSTNSQSDYAEAVLRYRQGKFKESVGLLDSALKESPRDLAAWELKGLALKELGDREKALSIFTTLRKFAISKELPAKQRGIYSFQSGMLLSELKRFDQAKPFLLESVKLDFNTTASQYFLGLIAFEKREDAESESLFRLVSQSGNGLLKANAFYYLGLLAKRKDDTKLAVWNWKESKRVALGVASTSSTNDANRRAAEAVITEAQSAIDTGSQEGTRSAWFGNAGLLTSYDSNVLLNPLVDVGSTGARTVMQTLRYGVGYLWGFSDAQLLTSLRGTGNYNFSLEARSGQFVINDLGLVYTVGPNRPVHWGVRTGALYILRNDTTQSNSGVLKHQSLGLPLGPFLTIAWTKFRWTTEFVATPQVFFSDASLDSYLRKTGVDWRLRNELSYRGTSRFLNPTTSLELYYQQTNGEEFRMTGASLNLTNPIRFSDLFTTTLRTGLAYNTYSQRPDGARYDTQLSFAVDFDYRVWNSLFAQVECSYLDNLSNITDVYRYNRFILGAGVDYRF
jgi:hypothetical protein